uniref:zinc finger (FYVE)-7 isoform X3 n=1 Tax=Ciona intestinalis TaxID=7719 RepID=UPI000EF47E42|nr:zinc finger (FYVE)-7 isoform X3 [Ciona intestinalis]|eukprot:XP_026693681.1 zinc finger (FYVE)-7 isoform X3 [Ciona intestinalis]
MEMSLGELTKEEEILFDDDQELDENSSLSKLEMKEDLPDVGTPDVEVRSIDEATLNSDIRSLDEDTIEDAPQDKNPNLHPDSREQVAEENGEVGTETSAGEDRIEKDEDATEEGRLDPNVQDSVMKEEKKEEEVEKEEEDIPKKMGENEGKKEAEAEEKKKEEEQVEEKSDSDASKERGSSVSFPAIFSTSLQSIRSTLTRKSLSKESSVPTSNTDDLVNDTKEEEKKNNGKKSMKVERRSLLGMAKLSVKGLIESSLSAGHTLDSDHVPLQQFFVIIEYVLRQGLKAPKNFFMPNKYFWPPLEAIEKFNSEASEITSSVRSLPGIRTHLGKGRAWLRLALMQKKLADYFKILIDNKAILSEWYDDGALIMNDEATVLAGHLVGLNCIDANLCMKGDDLDNQEMVIDYSLYMKDGNHGNHGMFMEDDNVEDEESQMQKLMDQKNYLEERNRHLEDASVDLQKRSDHLEEENKSMLLEVEALKIQITELKNERVKMMDEKKDMTVTHQKTLEIREKDLDTERETLRKSKAGLDEMYTQIQKQLKHETQMRMEVEKELELQMSLKSELDVAMKLLEKDIFAKQDGLVTLREQLDNVKAINMDVYNKLQAKSILEEEKNKTIAKLENETRSLAKKVSTLQQHVKKKQAKNEKSRIDLVWI